MGGISLEVWGDYACFTRPEFKTERYSYDVITPSAAVGILSSIYWHPGVEYIIDKITVLAPIQFTTIMRNEVKDMITPSMVKKAMNNQDYGSSHYFTTQNRQQRKTTLLKDVHYVIDARFYLHKDKANSVADAGKVMGILGDRVKKGSCYQQPFFGNREFVANFREFEGTPLCPPELKGEIDLGFMFHSYDYSNPADPKPRFFRAIMKDGTILVPKADSPEVKV